MRWKTGFKAKLSHGTGSVFFVALSVVFLLLGFSSVRAAEQRMAETGAPLKVAVSIKPLQSLVAAVMQGAGQPAVIVQGTGSEHGYQLRLMDAKNLSEAAVVFWAGPQMENFLQKPLQTLSTRAEIISLATVPQIRLLPLRTGNMFESHGHEHEHRGDLHEESATEETGADLHFWLDPQNAKAAVLAIADILAKKDPAHAALYQKNAKDYAVRLDSLTKKIKAELAPVRGRPFIVFHDAYQYFETRFAIPAAGSVTVNPEQAPGAKRLAEIRAKIKASGSVCVFSEPQFEPRLVQVLTENTAARTGVLDPLGSQIRSGPNQYLTLIQNLADSLKRCLSAKQ